MLRIKDFHLSSSSYFEGRRSYQVEKILFWAYMCCNARKGKIIIGVDLSILQKC